MQRDTLISVLLGLTGGLITLGIQAYTFFWWLSIFLTLTLAAVTCFRDRIINEIGIRGLLFLALVFIFSLSSLSFFQINADNQAKVTKCKENKIVIIQRDAGTPLRLLPEGVFMWLKNSGETTLPSPSVYLFHVPLGGKENIEKYGVVCEKSTINSRLDRLDKQEYRFKIPWSRLSSIQASFLTVFVKDSKLPCGFSSDVIYTASAGSNWHPRSLNDLHLDIDYQNGKGPDATQMDQFVDSIENLIYKHIDETTFDLCSAAL